MKYIYTVASVYSMEGILGIMKQQLGIVWRGFGYKEAVTGYSMERIWGIIKQYYWGTGNTIGPGDNGNFSKCVFIALLTKLRFNSYDLNT